MVREPVVAGQFYPADKDSLLKDLESMIVDRGRKIDVCGIVSPHAGYMYSGSVAGEVYGSINPKSTYVVLGPNHTGRGAQFAVSSDSWQTPLGVLAPDEELIENIITRTDLVTRDSAAHSFEHSIEVQLPFIQKISPEAKIVPITVQFGDISQLQEIGCAIFSAIKSAGRDALIVASSDMTHYESREVARGKDELAIQEIIELDAQGLLEVVEKNDISMCGYIPTAIMLIAAKEMGARKGKLIKYSDSGEVTGDVREVVGYAAIVIS